MRYLLLILILLGLGSCASEPVVAGGSSDQGNAIEVAVVDPLQRDVKAARIGVLPDTSTSNGFNIGLVTLDASGKILLQGFAPGRYTIAVEANGLLATHEVLLSNPKTSVQLNLKSSIRLTGQIPAAYGDSIAIRGLGKRYAVDSLGRFQIDSLPAGSWEIVAIAQPNFIKYSGYVEEGLEKELSSAGTDSSGVLKPLPPTLVPGGGYFDEPIRAYAWTSLRGTQMQWRLQGDSAWSPLSGAINIDSSMVVETRAMWKNDFISEINVTNFVVKSVPNVILKLNPAPIPDREKLIAYFPDSIWVHQDTLWFVAKSRVCSNDSVNGFHANQNADTLHVFQSVCTGSLGVPTNYLMYWPHPIGVWRVSSVVPTGYVFEVP